VAAPSPSKAPPAGVNRPREAEGQVTRLLAGIEDPGSADSATPSWNVRKSISSPEVCDIKEGKDRYSEDPLQIVIPVESKGIAKGNDQDRDNNRDRDRRTDYASPSEPVLTPRPPVSTLVLSLEPPISPSKQTGKRTQLVVIGMLPC
jgi:hypothetical protein